MVSTCIQFLLIVQSVSAACQGDAQDCKVPTVSEALSMVQHKVTKGKDGGRRQQSKTPKMSHRGTCVVWHSQHKSAGRAVELALASSPLKAAGVHESDWSDMRLKSLWRCDCDEPTWDCNNTKCVPPGRMNNKSLYRVVMRGYVGTLAGSKEFGRPGDGQCVWATMSREPVSRLISAYYYCKYGMAHDPLCGKSALNAQKATIQEWAKHWGNYLFRELLLNTDLRRFAENQPSFNSANASCHAPGWLSWKYQLNGGDDPRTASGKSNLIELKRHLRGEASPLYDLYGVMERWEETMALFDRVLPLERATWAEMSSDRVVDHNSHTWKAQEKKGLEIARKDPAVLAELAADIELYNEVIIPEFDKRMRRLKL